MTERVISRFAQCRQPVTQKSDGQGEEEAMTSAANCRGKLPQTSAIGAAFAWMTARMPRSSADFWRLQGDGTDVANEAFSK